MPGASWRSSPSLIAARPTGRTLPSPIRQSTDQPINPLLAPQAVVAGAEEVQEAEVPQSPKLLPNPVVDVAIAGVEADCLRG